MNSSTPPKKIKYPQFEFNSLLIQLLSEFITTDLQDIEPVVKKGLASIAGFYGVDEAFIGFLDRCTNDWGYFYKWAKEENVENEGPTANFYLSNFPWSKKRLLSGHGIKINDIHNSELLSGKIDQQSYLNSGSRAVLIEPLSVHHKIVPGVIALLSRTKIVNWQKEAPTNVKMMGDILANLISNKANEQEREKRERYILLLNKFTQYAFETTDCRVILDKMAEDFCSLMQADFCGFGVWDDDKKKVIPTGNAGAYTDEFLSLGEFPAQGTMTEHVLKTGKKLVIEDVKESDFKDNVITRVVPIQSFIIVPIRTKKRKMGAFIIGYKTRRKFDDQEIDMCEQAAAQIALTLSNLYSYLENVQHIEEMNTLSIVSTALRKAKSLAEIPDKIIEMIIAMNLADSVAMIIYDDPKEKPTLAKWGGKWNFNSPEELIHKLTITENVMKTGKVILDEEITRPSIPSPTTIMENSHFLLGFPLNANRKTMGVFCVGSDKPFKENRVSLLNAVAETISNAIYRQSMFDNLQVHLEALRTTKTQLVQSEKLAAIGELVAGVAHELNNPLTTISLSAELLLQQSVNEQDIYDLEKIVSESQRAAKIVKNLLDFSRQRAPERKSVNITQLVKSTTDLVSWELVKNNISFQYEFSETLPLTVADPNQLKQVFINIINNAIQAIKSQDKPGVIRIETQSGPSVFFGSEGSQEEMIRIIFTDNGPGIHPSILPRIFDPFFTTKKVSEGTGLGLSVCHGIITEHKGHIWAEDASEGGARILIEIPVEHPETDSTAENGHKNIPTSTAEKILVIEDEDSVLEVTQRALMRKGYIVDGVSNGLDGLECLKGNSYAVIVCDIRMSGMNGFEFYKEVNKIDRTLAKKIIFTSGDSIKPEYTSFLKLTGTTFLPKPFELDQLLEVVQDKIISLHK